MRTLSDSELTAVSGGAVQIPNPFPNPLPYPEGGGIPRPKPIVPYFNGNWDALDYSLKIMT